jgi:SAM-dependent methyltransferase
VSSGDFYASPLGAAYSAYMERPGLSTRISRRVWGGDTRPYYALMEAAGEVPAGGTIVDCPCGAGPALRAVPPHVRYVGVDLSPSMLRRARQRAAVRGLDNVEFVEAEATATTLPSGGADLVFSFWGLHCFPDPAAALREAARLLGPGGRLAGSCILRCRDTLRQRLLIRPNVGELGPMGSQAETESWLSGAGLELTAATRSGPFLFFDARAPEAR